MNKKYKGYLFVILSAVIFGSMPLMAKYIYAGGGNAISLVFYRSFLALPLIFIIMKSSNKGVSIKITLDELKKIFILVMGGSALTPVLLYNSYNYVSSGIATTIHFIYPIFVLIGCAILFKEKITLVKALCVLLCTAGILLLSNLGQIGDSTDLIGIGLSFASGITFAFYVIYLDKSGLKSMNQFELGFYMAIITAIAVLIYAAFTKTFTYSMTPGSWILTFIFANLVTVGAVVLFQTGIRYIGPQKASILSTFEPITSILTGILFLGEPLSFKTGVGIVLILISVVLLSKFDNETNANSVS